MKKIIIDKILTDSLFKCNKEIIFEFSKYVYSKRGQTERRKIIYISFHDLYQYTQLHDELENDEELALNSRIRVEGVIYHLALIDFKAHRLSSSFQEAILSIQNFLVDIKRSKDIKFYLFKSGSSYHGYFNVLLTQEEWIPYLGHLYLQNKSCNRENIIDSRWIAHSMKNGFCALRISNNTGHYSQLPEEVDYPSQTVMHQPF